MQIQTGTRFLGMISVDFNTLTPEVQHYLVAYGLKQSIDDAGASPEKGKAGSQARYKALLMGEVPVGGGSRLPPEERHARDIVLGYLTQAGFKKSDAQKVIVKDGAQAAFGAMLGLAFKKKAGSDPTPEQSAGLLAKNWPKIEAEVEKRMSAVADLPEVEI